MVFYVFVVYICYYYYTLNLAGYVPKNGICVPAVLSELPSSVNPQRLMAAY